MVRADIFNFLPGCRRGFWAADTAVLGVFDLIGLSKFVGASIDFGALIFGRDIEKESGRANGIVGSLALVRLFK